MKSVSVLPVILTLAHVASGYPSMRNILAEIKKRQRDTSAALIGDLETLADDQLTQTGKLVKDILTGSGDPQDLSTQYDAVPDKDSEDCKKDTCCIWKHIGDEMSQAMTEGQECNGLARAAIRLGFHDAGSWSRSTGTTGGADGSVLLANECEDRPENAGLRNFCPQMRQWFDKYKSYGISMADLIQFGAKVGTITCPTGPRIRSFIGRKDSTQAAPEGNLPGPFDEVDNIIRMFEDKTISPAALVALLGAHTVSRQTTAFANRTNAPQDSTPGLWDTNFFRETVDPNAPREVAKLDSDVKIATDPRTKAQWESYGQLLTDHSTWDKDYAREYIRLSLLGVDNINDLTECTKALPGSTSTSTGNEETSTGNEETSIGNGETSTGNEETSTGNEETSTGNEETSTGNEETSTGNEETSIGNGETSTGNEETSIGDGETSTGNGETSTGNEETSTGNEENEESDASSRLC